MALQRVYCTDHFVKHETVLGAHLGQANSHAAKHLKALTAIAAAIDHLFLFARSIEREILHALLFTWPMVAGFSHCRCFLLIIVLFVFCLLFLFFYMFIERSEKKPE